MPQPNVFKKRIVFAVTNDLNYDQRMIRICTSLQKNGYDVLLVGKKLKASLPLSSRLFRQKRLPVFFEKGKGFYLEYNFRLFFFLLFQKMDLIGAIDLDTILPCYFISVLKGKKRVYDAHELFCEMKEVVTRPSVYKIWKGIEKFVLPKFKYGYTVNEPIRDIFKKEYGVNYEVIMNVPFQQQYIKTEKENFIIYQGAVNHGRSFETLIPAFQWIDCPLFIYGDGNFLEECRKLIQEYHLEQKVLLKGKVVPEDLRQITPGALFGLTLFENNGLNNYYSLGNRFFDYIQAGIPQICVNYPAYQKINEEFEVAVLISDLSPACIAATINALLQNKELQKKLQENCLAAGKLLNWENEEKKLLHYYQRIFSE